MEDQLGEETIEREKEQMDLPPQEQPMMMMDEETAALEAKKPKPVVPLSNAISSQPADTLLS